ncbi:polymorphic toxin-type HINT domain-containing protein [Streptacidiphilus sp. N1-3]|uniref:Polymorphic toxin-type HINT domain-containing protein n=1 Tax=Streptacidiphilus alkalitolerans TaxID=3342712 RepID=A0ABV6X023_9ACTN
MAGRWLGALGSAALIASVLANSGPAAALASAKAPALPRVAAVTGVTTSAVKKVDVKDQTKRVFQATATSWPGAATATAALAAPATGRSRGTRAAAHGTPVWASAVAPAKGAYAGPSAVSVRMLAHQDATSLGVSGVVFTVGAGAGAGGSGAVQVGLDASGFAQAYGGNYASRLHLVRLPACALTTPQLRACRTQTPLTTSHDSASTVSTTLSVGTARTALVLAATDTTGGDGGSAGSYAATPLKPSGSWTAGSSTGSFDYTYPVTVADSSGALQPQVGLSYDSGSVDGQTASTQAQAGWAGDGWSTPDSYIEQSFASCADKPEGTASPTSSGDECYDGPILTLSLNGSSTTLIQDDTTGDWVAGDGGKERVTHVTGANNGSGTYNTDYWTVTERDGTTYEFGRNQLPGWSTGKPVTNSVDSEPVYSAHSGDPCYSSSGFTSSVCTMAYKWHLDYVVDPHADAMAYYYGQDSNYYGEDNGAHNVSYVRDSYLERVDYGFRDGGAFGTVPDQIVFTSTGRCTAATCDALSKTTAPTEYPDVPFDLVCASGATCTSYSPSFFSTVRLSGITSQQYSVAAAKFLPVDTYTLHQSEPATGDGTSPTLWLSSITHEGDDAGGGGSTTPITVPDVKFAGTDLQNRVDTSNFPGLYRYRISGITNETGAYTSVSYGLPYPCTAAYVASATASSNTKSCYPVSWTPKDYTAPITDWFEKYAATQVLETDTTGGAVTEETDYTYTGGAAWHYDDNEVVKAKYRTWGQFRGYGTVETQTGDGANDPKTESVTSYYRGMDGDWLAAGSTRSVNVTDSQGGSHTDADQLAGKPLETTAYLGTGGPVDHSTITSYWVSPALATRARTGLPALTANAVGTAETWTRQALTDHGSTSWRTTETDTTYNTAAGDLNFALPTYSYAHTVPVDPAYDRCTATSYAAPNTTANLGGLVSATEADSVACSGFVENTASSVPKSFNALGAAAGVSRPAQVVTATRNFYDDPTFATTFPQAAAPTAGDVTMTRTAKDYSAGAFVWQTSTRAGYDAYGRVLTSYDALGNKTVHAYTLNAVGLTTGVKITNPLLQSVSTTLDPARSLTLTSTDANNLVTTTQYDPLGRTTALWLHNRPVSVPADDLYSYALSQTGLSGSTTQQLNDALGYNTSVTIYDSLGRTRQTQAPTPQGGRMITESFYDSRGEVRKKNNAYWDPANTPALALFTPQNPQDPGQDAQIPDQDVYTFDGLGRTVVDDSLQYSVVKQETVTVYNGDSTTVIPPTGGTATTTSTDPLGRTTALASYTVRPAVTRPADPFTGLWYVTGGTSTAITYGYDGHGLQSTVTDAGSTWTTSNDLLGRAVGKVDPDAGSSTMVYDADGNLLQATDARGDSTSTTYDALNRKTGSYASATAAQSSGPTGNQSAAWVYDNANSVAGVTDAVGQLTTETSYSGGNTYTSQALGFNSFGEALGTTVTIPSAEGALGRAYTFKQTYTGNTGLLYSDNYPLGGGLPAQVVTHTYATALDLPNGLGDTAYGYAQGTSFNAYGQVQQEVLGGGTSTASVTSAYDPHTGALTDQLVTRSTTAPAKVDEQAYSYDPAGNVTAQASTRLGAATPSETQCYTYDGLDRLTTAWTATDNCAGAPSTGAGSTVGDPLGAASAYWTSWTFNAAGQRDTQVQHSTTGGTDTTTAYQYNGNSTNQPHTPTSDTTTGGSTASDAASFDKDGNTLSRTTPANGSQNFTWGPTGRLDKITSGTSTTSYVYDADGNVLLQKDPGSTVLYLPGEQITLTGTSTTGVRYLALPGGGTAVRTAAGTNYGFELGDLHGTDELYLDSTAQTPTWRQSTPYGAPRGTLTSWVDNRGFLDKPNDSSTGLTSVGARQYDPLSGNFISLDPMFEATSTQQLNGYDYAGSNPVTHSDPTGLSEYAGGDSACDTESCLDEATPDPTTKKGVTEIYPGVTLKNKIKDFSQLRWAFYKEMIKQCGSYQPGMDCADATAQPQLNVSFSGIFETVAQSEVSQAMFQACLDIHCGEMGEIAYNAVAAGANLQAQVGGDELSGGGGHETPGTGSKADPEGNLALLTQIRKGPSCNSFDPDTQVLMSDGSTKAIKDLQVGDSVQTGDPATGKPDGSRKITATLVNHDDNLLDVTVDTGHGHQAVLHTTTEHPFWDATTKTWVDAADLTPGDHLATAAGIAGTPTVKSVTPTPGATNRFNLTVQQLHTYYVLAGSVPVLVHNSSCLTQAGLDFPGIAHALDEHTNVTPEEAIELAGQKDSGKNSVFVDQQTAQQVADYAVAFNAGRIQNWLRGPKQQLTFSGTFGRNNSLGTTYFADGSQKAAGNGYFIQLTRAKGYPGGFYISTLHPQ